MLLSNFWFCELQASKDQTRLDWIWSQVQVLSTVYLINTKNLSELQYSTFPNLSSQSSQSNLKQEEILNLYWT